MTIQHRVIVAAAETAPIAAETEIAIEGDVATRGIAIQETAGVGTTGGEIKTETAGDAEFCPVALKKFKTSPTFSFVNIEFSQKTNKTHTHTHHTQSFFWMFTKELKLL